MAIADPYATATEYRDSVNLPDTTKDALINRQLVAISRYVEKKAHRTFNQDAAAVSRIYVAGEDGHRRDTIKEVFIDDLVSVSAIKFDTDSDGDFSDEAGIASTDYELLPRNATKGPEPTPYTSFVLTPYGDYGSISPGTRIEVRGIFGWPAVPAAIKEVTIALGSLLRLETARATTEIPAGLDATLDASPDAQRIIHSMLNPYIRHWA